MQWSIELWGYHVTIWQFAGNLSFGLTALSFYVRDMLALRALSIVAGAIGVVYNYFLPQGALWLVIFWLCVFMAINGFRIAHLVLERRGVSFNDEERELFETVFKNFEPVEFMKLLRIGEWRSAEANAVLIVEGETVEELVMIYNGEVIIEKGGAEVARSRDGALIGEMSFIQGGKAVATVRTARPTRCLAWSQEELRKLLRRNPTMDIAMSTVFSLDLARKLGGAPG